MRQYDGAGLSRSCLKKDVSQESIEKRPYSKPCTRARNIVKESTVSIETGGNTFYVNIRILSDFDTEAKH